MLKQREEKLQYVKYKNTVIKAPLNVLIYFTAGQEEQ